MAVIANVCLAGSIARADDAEARQETLDALRHSVRYTKPAAKTSPATPPTGVSRTLGSLAQRLATPGPAPRWDGVQPVSHQAPVVISDESPVVPAVAEIDVTKDMSQSSSEASPSTVRINPLREPAVDAGGINKSAESSNPLRSN